MTHYYKLRVDTDDPAFLSHFCKHYTKKYLYGIEGAGTDNIHTHFYLSTTSTSSAIREHIRTRLGRGNRMYSLTKLDEQYPLAYLAYCLKENNYQTNLSDEKIEEAKAYDENVKQEMKEKKKSKRTQLQCIDDALIEKYGITAREPTYDRPHPWDTSDHRTLSKEQIVDHVISYYKETGILVRQFQLVSISQTLCLKYVPSYDYEFKNSILEKI